jgi:hypothetical protein
MIKVFCECEHLKHLDYPDANHKYGERIEPDKLVKVQTFWGKYTVCKTCAETCLAQFIDSDMAAKV